jgi:hypothetical protein
MLGGKVIITKYQGASMSTVTVTDIDTDRAAALRWLRGSLAWEATLNQLRNPEHDDSRLAAPTELRASQPVVSDLPQPATAA